MQLPAALKAALDAAVSGFALADLERAAAALSDAYRSGKPPRLDTEAARAAYAVTRMPATYAAVRAALSELPEGDYESAADWGSGFGAGTWALDMQEVVRVERNAALLGWATDRLATPGKGVQQDLNEYAFTPVDLGLFSYSLGELSEPAQANVLDRAWKACRKGLVIVEPGTMAGFAVIRRARTQLLAHLHAPCPHALACPMAADDWCHFAARVERSALHRRLKGGTLGHEDEKFSYAIFTRGEPARAEARIIRHPRHDPGLIQLTLCQADGRARIASVRQRDKANWRQARKAEWGSRWSSIT